MYSVTMTFAGKPVRKFSFDKDFVTIGRDADCDVVIENVGASRRHAQIARTPQAYFLSDLQSHNGTYLGGERVTRRVLGHGAEFQIGKYGFRFESTDAVAENPPAEEAVAALEFAEPSDSAPSAAHATSPATGPSSAPATGPVFVSATGAAALLAAAPAPAPARAELGGAASESTMHLDRREIEKILGKFTRGKAAQLVQVAPPSEKRTVVLERAYYVIGADKSADIRTPGWFAAAKAGVLVRTDNGWRALSIASSFCVSGNPAPDAPLKDGDLVEVGRRRFRFCQG